MPESGGSHLLHKSRETLVDFEPSALIPASKVIDSADRSCRCIRRLSNDRCFALRPRFSNIIGSFV